MTGFGLDEVERVAILRASRLGDYVCAIPAVRALRQGIPKAEITYIGLPFVRELAERSPHIDRFEAFPGWPGIAEQWFDAREASAFFRRMQAKRFGLVVQLHGSGVYSNPAALMLGGTRTAGFVREGDPPGRLDLAVPFPGRGRESERLLALTAALGCPGDGEGPALTTWPQDEREATALVAGLPQPLVGVHVGSLDEEKRWDARAMLEAGCALSGEGTAVLIGGAVERKACERLAAGRPGVVSLAGRTSVPVLVALIAKLDLLVTTDSGPAHILYAGRTPSVTVFTATDPERWGPPAGTRRRVIRADARTNAGDIIAAGRAAMAAAQDAACSSSASSGSRSSA